MVVQLDGQAYREYTIDFSSGSVTTTAKHEYVVETTAPPTEPTTEATEPTEVVTEPYPTDEQQPTGPVTNGY